MQHEPGKNEGHARTTTATGSVGKTALSGRTVAAKTALAAKNDRLASAAQAALDGLHLGRRDANTPWGTAARSPGVEMLFGPGAHESVAADAPPEDAPPDDAAPDDAPPDDAPGGDAPGAEAPADGVEPEDQPAAADHADAGADAPGEGPAAPERAPLPFGSGSTPPARPAISHLTTRRGGSEVIAVVTLAHEGRTADGRATGVPSNTGVLRTVAEATIAAVDTLIGGGLLVGVDAIKAPTCGDASAVSVVLAWSSDGTETTLVGVAAAATDVERAVAQATLDALNRHVAPLLARR